jgi:ATP-binding cassette subfamily B (MDR/TAP) protein 1
MPAPNTDDPFNENKLQSSSFSPPNTEDTENTFPPTSPNDSLDSEKGSGKENKKDKKAKGPTPLFKPSMALLFSLSNRRDKLTILLPAMIFSLAAGVVPPIMTFVLGDAFDKFTTYQKALSYQNALPPSLKDMSEANTALKNGMIRVAIELIVLGVFAVVLTTAALWLWVWHGERVAKRLRYKMYAGVIAKPMAWFDLGMGKRIGESAGTGDEDDIVGENESSGGLMGRFTR